jgi:hypothetical protein
MTEQEIKAWLNVHDVDRQLRPDIVTGMADVPVPAGAGAQLDAFRALLACWRPGQSFWKRPAPAPVHIRFWAEGGILRITHDGVDVNNRGGLLLYLRSSDAILGKPVILEVD